MNRKDKIKFKSVFYSICRALTEQFVRWMPIVCTLFVLAYSVENLYALEYEKYVDMGGYYLLDIPITSVLIKYFHAPLTLILFMYITSKVYLFCIYHRIFIYFLFLHFICDEYLKNYIFNDNYFIYYLILGISSIAVMITALILHQIHGDRQI